MNTKRFVIALACLGAICLLVTGMLIGCNEDSSDIAANPTEVYTKKGTTLCEKCDAIWNNYGDGNIVQTLPALPAGITLTQKSHNVKGGECYGGAPGSCGFDCRGTIVYTVTNTTTATYQYQWFTNVRTLNPGQSMDEVYQWNSYCNSGQFMFAMLDITGGLGSIEIDDGTGNPVVFRCGQCYRPVI